jgi:hypothetical protein
LSGHTSSAFAGASFIQRRYGFKQAIISYGLAIATGASRIYAKKHYSRDVIAGAVISCLWPMFLVDKKSNLEIRVDEDATKLVHEVEFEKWDFLCKKDRQTSLPKLFDYCQRYFCF